MQRYAGTGGKTIFCDTATISANIVVPDARWKQIELARGFVTKIRIRFPPGSHGLLWVAIWDDDKQIFPGNSGQYFHGDNEVIEFDTEYDVPEYGTEYRFWLKLLNYDETYEHAVIVSFETVLLP